jgi:mannose-6-phosphate isomerase-like protein (cupin superfamily)
VPELASVLSATEDLGNAVRTSHRGWAGPRQPRGALMIVSDSFVIADWTDPGTHPGRPIAGLHLHRSDDEAWVVLEGRLGFRVGEEEREVLAGESILVSRGTPHSYWNPTAEPARYLLVMTPQIHRLIEALHAGERTDFAQVFEEHDSELLS